MNKKYCTCSVFQILGAPSLNLAFSILDSQHTVKKVKIQLALPTALLLPTRRSEIQVCYVNSYVEKVASSRVKEQVAEVWQVHVF